MRGPGIALRLPSRSLVMTHPGRSRWAAGCERFKTSSGTGASGEMTPPPSEREAPGPQTSPAPRSLQAAELVTQRQRVADEA